MGWKAISFNRLARTNCKEFYVAKYVSLEALISKNKYSYYESLEQAGVNWHEENENVIPFVKYILGTILVAYKAFEDRFSIVEEKLPSVELVRKATLQKLGRFTKQDIRELCPSLSVSSIEGSLRKLIAEGEIKREGVGRATKYIRLK